MESVRTTMLSNTMLYKDGNTSYSLRLVECEGGDCDIHHKFGIIEYRYQIKTRQWVPVRHCVYLPVSVWPTLLAHGQRVIESLVAREPTKHDQATETSVCGNSDAVRPDMSNVATEVHEPQLERAVKVIRVECEPARPVEKAVGKARGRPRKHQEHVEKPTSKPAGRPRKRPASPAAAPSAKHADTDHDAQQ